MISQFAARFLPLALACLLAGCAAPAPSPRSGPVGRENESLFSDEAAAARAEAFARFATGISHELNDRSDQALDQFYRAVEADPSNEILAIELSRRLLQKEDQRDKAIRLLTRVESRPGSSALVSSWLGQACLQTGRTNQALQASRAAVRKAPEYIEGYRNLVEIYLQKSQPREAAQVLARASSLSSTNLPFLLGVAELEAFLFRLQPREAEAVRPQALATLKRLVDLKPSSPAILQKLADNHGLWGDFKKCGELYLDLVERYKDDSPMRTLLWERLTTQYRGSAENQKKVAPIEAQIRQNAARYPQSEYFLAVVANDRKEHDQAFGQLERLLAARPDYEQAYYELADLQMSAEKPDEALKTLDRARARFPRSFLVEFWSGVAHSRRKSYGDAVKSFTTAELIAAASDPGRLTAGFYYYFGAAAERSKDFDRAEKLFLRSVELRPDFGESLNYVGYMWADRNEKLDRAKEFIERAVKLEPANAAFLDSLGWVYYRLNQPRKALEFIRQSIEHSKEPDATIYDHLGDIYQALGRTREAGVAWRKSLKIEANDDVRRKLEKMGPQNN